METKDLTYDAALARVQSIIEEVSARDLPFEQVKQSLIEAYDCLNFCRSELQGLRDQGREFSHAWSIEEGARDE